MRRQYKKLKLGPKKLQVIKLVNQICANYARQGYDLTLRQLYYQFVQRNLLPNTIQSYKWLGDIVNDGRLAGLIDWDYIVDRTRGLKGLRTYKDPKDLIKKHADAYYIDKWKDQPIRPEVWVEKEALAGVVARATSSLQVDHLSCRGYVSQSEMWEAGQRISRLMRNGQGVHIIHLGDHDPSGMDMSRDIEERLRMFIDKNNATSLVDKIFMPLLNASPFDSSQEWRLADPSGYDKAMAKLRVAQDEHGTFTFERIALNMAQIEELEPPPNPAKFTDSRAKAYVEEFGRESWELDALDPTYLNRIITEAILDVQDPDLWAVQEAIEEEGRDLLHQVAQYWDEVATYVRHRS